MLIKALFVIIAFCVLWRWALGKWPWASLRAPSARERALKQARVLLGVAEGAGREDIITAHRRLTALVHPDKGGTTAAMQEANAARDLLLGELPPALPAAPDDEPPSQSPE
jgi:hypothetical protein